MPDGQDVLASLLAQSVGTWQLSDGRGALARGTRSGAPTQRSLALLAAPHVGPRAELPAVALLRFDDRVAQDDGSAFELTPAFGLASRGDGLRELVVRAARTPVLETFREHPWPRWTFRGDGWRLEREYRLIEGHAALLATWRLVEGGPVRLHVAPLLVARALGGLQAETPEFRGAVTGIPGRVRILTVEGYAPLTLWHGGAFMPARAWQRGVVYPLDGGCDPLDPDAGTLLALEDAFLPGWIQCALPAPGATLHIVASPEEPLFRTLATEARLGVPPARTLADCLLRLDLAEGERREAWQREALAGAADTARRAAAAHAGARGVSDDCPDRGPAPVAGVATLAARLLDSLHERADRTAVLTDAAHCEEHGADALRVAAGLVTLRQFGRARDIVRGYLAYLDEGLAPEGFDAQGRPHYATPEASLWLVHVVDLLTRRDDDQPAAQAFLRDTAWPALESVLHHLRSGSRHGVHCDRDGFLWSGEGEGACARADLNALWYHALVATSQLAKIAHRRENAAFYMAWGRELQRGYAERFWDDAAGCLYPRFDRSLPVRGVAPAQLYAVCLPPMLLAPEISMRLVGTLTRELWTARGLRPRPDDGEPEAGWLGPWASATLRAHGRDAATAQRVRRVLAMAIAGGTLDLTPRGAADLLRAWIEEVDHPARELTPAAG